MGREGPSVVVKLLTTFRLLLDELLGTPLCHSSAMLLTTVACAVLAVVPPVGVLPCCLRLVLPVGRQYPGNQICVDPPIGWSRVASALWLGAGVLQLAPLCWHNPCV